MGREELLGRAPPAFFEPGGECFRGGLPAAQQIATGLMFTWVEPL